MVGSVEVASWHMANPCFHNWFGNSTHWVDTLSIERISCY